MFHCEDGGYWGEFPTLKECYTQGDTFSEVCLMTEDALCEVDRCSRDDWK